MEFAGIALAVFPLVIQGISNLVQAASTVKRFKHYHRELKRDTRMIENEWTGFQLSIENLVSCIGYSYEDSQALLKDPGGKAWRDPRFRKKLQAYMDDSYRPFVQTIEEVVDDLELLCEKLGIDSDTKEVQTVAFFESAISRFKHTFGQPVYKEIFDRIRGANDFLRRTAFQKRESQTWRAQGKSRLKGAGIGRLRQQARSLHQSLARRERWSCACRDRHLLGLDLGELEARMSVPKTVNVTFDLAIATVEVNSMIWSPPVLDKWQTVKIECEEQNDDQDACSGQHSLNQAIQAKVQFHLDAVAKAQHPQTIISDLCSVIHASRPQGNTTPADPLKAYLGHLKIIEPLSPMHGLFRSSSPWISGRTPESIQDLLGRLSSTNQVQQGAAIFPRRSRLVVAAQLALGVIVLDGSWLKADWTSRDFLVVRGALQSKSVTGTANEEDALLLPWELREDNNGLTLASSQSTDIRCVALFALGITLIELSLGAKLDDLKEACDENQEAVISKRKSAFRLLPRVEEQEGDIYANVVERCLDCPFDLARRDLSFDNAKFRDLVYEAVVKPLKEIAAVFTRT